MGNYTEALIELRQPLLTIMLASIAFMIYQLLQTVAVLTTYQYKKISDNTNLFGTWLRFNFIIELSIYLCIFVGVISRIEGTVNIFYIAVILLVTYFCYEKGKGIRKLRTDYFKITISKRQLIKNVYNNLTNKRSSNNLSSWLPILLFSPFTSWVHNPFVVLLVSVATILIILWVSKLSYRIAKELDLINQQDKD